MRTALLALTLLLAAGCGGEPPAATPAEGAPPPQEAVARVGDTTVRATALQTSQLGEAVAREYGLARDDGRVLLLVAVRRGAEGQETSVPARVTARVTDLRGRQQPVEMRELRSGDLLDYVGTTGVSPPDTLRFDIDVVAEDGTRADLQFTREFFPR